MPSFDFSIITKKKDKVKKESNIIKKDTIGVIFIDINGIYSVKVDNDFYPINPNNYTCKGKMIVYSQELTESFRRLIYIRTEDSCVKLPRNAYLPFTVGCSVLGNIIKNIFNKLPIFDIKRVIIDDDKEDAKEAIKFYKLNYDIIQRNRKIKHE